MNQTIEIIHKKFVNMVKIVMDLKIKNVLLTMGIYLNVYY
jgi:hypothetical protein